jgi:hypothetical protein
MLAVLENIHGFAQPLQSDGRIAPQIMPQLLFFFIFLPIPCWLITMSLNTVYLELLTESLNKPYTIKQTFSFPHSSFLLNNMIYSTLLGQYRLTAVLLNRLLD